MDEYEELMAALEANADPTAVEGMSRFGISANNTLGVSVPVLRDLAKKAGKDHELARRLWASGVHEARILAAFVDEPKQVSERQMDEWAAEFDSWDVCDQVCANLFDKTPYAFDKAVEWSAHEEEFVKRAGFALMAALAWHDKKAPDEKFLPFLPIIEKEGADGRNYVKKAVNWALRQIGKHSRRLNKVAIASARSLQAQPSSSAKWIASDALRELTSEKVQARLKE